MPLGQPYTSATCRSPAKGSSRSSSPANGRSSSPSGSALREHVPFEKFGDLTTMFEGENGIYDVRTRACTRSRSSSLRSTMSSRRCAGWRSRRTARPRPRRSRLRALSTQKLEELLAAYRYSHDDVHEHAYQAEMPGRRPHGGALGRGPWPQRGRAGKGWGETHGSFVLLSTVDTPLLQHMKISSRVQRVLHALHAPAAQSVDDLRGDARRLVTRHAGPAVGAAIAPVVRVRLRGWQVYTKTPQRATVAHVRSMKRCSRLSGQPRRCTGAVVVLIFHLCVVESGSWCAA